jgi:hypothetical protein
MTMNTTKISRIVATTVTHLLTTRFSLAEDGEFGDEDETEVDTAVKFGDVSDDFHAALH